jgi:DNA topoisomerase VI subunit B
MPQTLQRTTFQTSRLLDFFDGKELQMAIGFPKEQWPIALVKELIDNALDACETAGIPPQIEIAVEADMMSVRDHGPGLPVKTLKSSLNYMFRVSDKAHYVSPSRGQLGNALKCLWAAPYVARGEQGYVEVVTRGSTHRIAVRLDRIAQRPDLQHQILPDGFVKNGTLINVIWPGIAGYLDPAQMRDFYNPRRDVRTLVQRYAAFNPHASWRLTWLSTPHQWEATDPTWRKWKPSDPTSPHWYTAERLRALIAAYLTIGRQQGKGRTVREFVSEFAGLTGTLKQKAVTEAAGLTRSYLDEFVMDQDVSLDKVAALLVAMQAHSRPIKPATLGVLGEAHLARHLVERCYAEASTVRYKKAEGEADGLPFVLEVAFGIYQKDFQGCGREVLIGLNWSPALREPFAALPTLLGEARVNGNHPVVVCVHLACPRLEYTDRGKTIIALPEDIREALAKSLKAVTKEWTAKMRQADREGRLRERELEELRKAQQQDELNIKESAFRVMETAYFEASSQKRYPGIARMIMYAARRMIRNMPGGKVWKDKNSALFTQGYLPAFLREYPELTADWDVVWDARGHLIEPHTGERVDLGGIPVRRYVQRWHQAADHGLSALPLDTDYPTCGPANRFQAVLFVEKEGFHELLDASGLLPKYDLALMSTKGMSVTAARALVEHLSVQGVTTFVVHDFDKAGFSILHTLRTDTKRYRFKTPPLVVDLGLRLADVEAMALEPESVEYEGKDPRIRLRECGATEEECDYLIHGRDYTGGWRGQRVELNAMLSAQRFIDWLEAKLQAHGVKKVIPDDATLAKAYRRAVRQARVQQAIDDAIANLPPAHEISVPDGLAERIGEKLKGSARAWDDVLVDLVSDDVDEEVVDG